MNTDIRQQIETALLKPGTPSDLRPLPSVICHLPSVFRPLYPVELLQEEHTEGDSTGVPSAPVSLITVDLAYQKAPKFFLLTFLFGNALIIKQSGIVFSNVSRE